MVINRKVDRYVQEVLQYIPSRERGEAEQEISEMLIDLIRDHAAGKEPDILDARAVIEELGSPEIMAVSWMEARGDTEEEPLFAGGWIHRAASLVHLDRLDAGKVDKVTSTVLMICSALAVLLVSIGIIALSTHLITTMLPIFLGCVLGLVAAAGRGVLMKQA